MVLHIQRIRNGIKTEIVECYMRMNEKAINDRMKVENDENSC